MDYFVMTPPVCRFKKYSRKIRFNCFFNFICVWLWWLWFSYYHYKHFHSKFTLLRLITVNLKKYYLRLWHEFSEHCNILFFKEIFGGRDSSVVYSDLALSIFFTKLHYTVALPWNCRPCGCLPSYAIKRIRNYICNLNKFKKIHTFHHIKCIS